MSTQIRYRWRTGETLRYRMMNQGTTAITGGPDGMSCRDVEQTISQVFRIVVEDERAGDGTTLLQFIDSVRMEMGSSLGKVTYDSADRSASPANSAMAGIFSTMIGEPVRLELLPTGAVRRVEGFSRLLEKVSKNVPADPDGMALLNALKGTFSDDSWRSMFGQTFTQFPDRPLELGETWNTHIDVRLPMIGRLPTSIAATLTAVEGKASRQVARMAMRLRGELNPAVSAPGDASVSGIEMGKSTGDGEILFDITEGRLLQSTTRTTMELTMGGLGPDGTTIRLKPNIKNTITMELVQSR